MGALRTFSRDFPYSGPLRLAVANLIGATSAGARDDGEDPGGADFAAAVATSRDEALSRRIGQLESAISRRKRVRFAYYSISQDETSDREVEPYILSRLDGAWYVTGWDVVRGAVRQFRVSRIESRVTFVTRRSGADFDVPESFERRLAGPRAPWQLGELDRTARIRLSPEAMRKLRGPLRWAGTFERDNGAPVFVTPYSGERQLSGWVLSQGEDARVLSPASLVDRTREGLERILAEHAEDRA